MKQRSCDGRGNAPKKTGARSARARTRGRNLLVVNILLSNKEQGACKIGTGTIIENVSFQAVTRQIAISKLVLIQTHVTQTYYMVSWNFPCPMQ